MQKKIAVIAYTTFSTDSRVQKEAQAAFDAGYSVDVYTLNETNLKNFDHFNFYFSQSGQYKGRGKVKYTSAYLKFFLFTLFLVTKNSSAKRYKIIHVHNMPNFLVFTALIPKLFGAKIILDIHDLVPEIYSVKFGLQLTHPIIKLLYLEERLSARFANEIISTNKFHTERFKKNRITNKNFTEIINVASSKTFNYVSNKNYNSNVLNIIYPSTLSLRLGVGILIDAISFLKQKNIPVKLKIFGDGEDRDKIIQMIKGKNLDNEIFISNGFISLKELSLEMDNAHLGVIPLPFNVSNDIAMPVKSYEYFSKKICVVASDLTLLKNYFPNEMLFFKQNNAEDLSKKLELLYYDRKRLREYALRGYETFRRKEWKYYANKYINLLNFLSSKQKN